MLSTGPDSCEDNGSEKVLITMLLLLLDDPEPEQVRGHPEGGPRRPSPKHDELLHNALIS
jgi:hypothetical protein